MSPAPLPAATLDDLRFTLALIAELLRWALNLGVFAFGYWQVAHE